MKHKAVLMLGSNLGSREEYLNRAIDLIEAETGEIISRSSVYSSKAVGYKSENMYLNQALLIETDLSPLQLLDKTQNIERHLGRIRSTTERYTDRTIDIDIQLFDNLTVEHKRLSIPHPELHRREFVLTPLREIIPRWEHPVLGITIEQLWDAIKKDHISS